MYFCLFWYATLGVNAESRMKINKHYYGYCGAVLMGQCTVSSVPDCKPHALEQSASIDIQRAAFVHTQLPSLTDESGACFPPTPSWNSCDVFFWYSKFCDSFWVKYLPETSECFSDSLHLPNPSCLLSSGSAGQSRQHKKCVIAFHISCNIERKKTAGA